MNEEYNFVVGGHDDDGETIQESVETPVQYMTSDDAIKREKCIVFTDVLMSLITSLHGTVCKRQGCDRALEYKKRYVGTCLVVSCGVLGCLGGAMLVMLEGDGQLNQHAKGSELVILSWLLLCCSQGIHTRK